MRHAQRVTPCAPPACAQVAVPLSLDLRPFMAPGALDDGATAYSLYGLVQHVGLAPPGGPRAGRDAGDRRSERPARRGRPVAAEAVQD
jgi:hypothetical protein